MAQKASFLEKVKMLAKAISYHLFPESYENLKQFAVEAKKGSFQVEVIKKNTSSLNLENNTSNSQTGMEYFRLRGRGYGKKRDIVCDVSIGCYSPLLDASELLKKEVEKKREIIEVFNFFDVPFKIEKGMLEKIFDTTPAII